MAQLHMIYCLLSFTCFQFAFVVKNLEKKKRMSSERRGGFSGSRGRGFSENGASTGRGGYRGSRGRGNFKNGASTSHGGYSGGRGRGNSENGASRGCGGYRGGRGMLTGKGNSENGASRGRGGYRGSRGMSSRGNNNSERRAGYRGGGGRGQGRALGGSTKSKADKDMSDEETKPNTTIEFNQVFQVFTGFRGETLFAHRDREAKKQQKIRDAPTLLKQDREISTICEYSKSADGNPSNISKKLGIVSKINNSEQAAKRIAIKNATQSNMVSKSTEMQVFDLSHVTQSEITGEITSTRGRGFAGRGRGSVGRGRGVKKNISDSWSVNPISKADDSNISKETSNKKRTADLDGGTSKRAKV